MCRLFAFTLLAMCWPTKAYSLIIRNEAGRVTTQSSYLPTNCAEAVKLAGHNATNDVYKISLPLLGSDRDTHYVYCLLDPNGGEAWTVIQRRQSNSVHFNRNWDDYKQGFGNLNTNFFIGLNKLYAMTQLQLHELWIELKDFDDIEKYAKYDSFAIGDERQQYALNILGTHSGTAGDSLTFPHEGSKFSTPDQENSERDTNCAETYQGGWWFGEDTCKNSFLNGRYEEHPHVSNGKGIVWHSWHGMSYSLKYVHMAIRPKKLAFLLIRN